MNVVLARADARPQARRLQTPWPSQARSRTSMRAMGTTSNSPQTNHRKNITSFFPVAGLLVRFDPPCTTLFGDALCECQTASFPDNAQACPRSSTEIEAAPARHVSRTRMVEVGVMPNQDELDAMTKAWTYAVLDALESADEKTRLEIVRILCPAGFVVVPMDSVEPSKHREN
jgi:hypothetical protein